MKRNDAESDDVRQAFYSTIISNVLNDPHSNAQPQETVNMAMEMFRNDLMRMFIADRCSQQEGADTPENAAKLEEILDKVCPR